MTLKVRYQLLNASQMQQLLEAIAEQILSANPDPPIILLGVQRRGAPLAARLAGILRDRGLQTEVGKLDINLYRDDLTMVSAHPVVRKTELPSDISGRDVILIDDVLYTGRTIRAALEALNDHGRAQSIRLGVLVDRGRRELPIQPDFVGMKIESEHDEIVELRVEEIDGEDSGWVLERNGDDA